MSCTSGIRPMMIAMPVGNNTTALGFMSLYYMLSARRVGKGCAACKQAGCYDDADNKKILKKLCFCSVHSCSPPLFCLFRSFRKRRHVQFRLYVFSFVVVLTSKMVTHGRQIFPGGDVRNTLCVTVPIRMRQFPRKSFRGVMPIFCNLSSMVGDCIVTGALSG